MTEKIVEIDAEKRGETDRAILVFSGSFDTKGDEVRIWLPKSECEYDPSDNTVQMPEWLAQDKGLI